MSSVSKLIFGTAIAAIGVFAAVVCFEKPAAAQNYAWCAYYDFGQDGATNCGFSNVSTMLGDRERGWWIVWTQSAIPELTGTISVD
jgi:hypothetical protein